MITHPRAVPAGAFNFAMNTKILRLEGYIENGILSEEDLLKLSEAACCLKNGGLVAFPTETVYGLGGDARRKEVSARIYKAKGRPSDNPLIVHISSMEELPQIISGMTEDARKLCEAFWPGPMTLVFNKTELIPGETTGGLDTVAVRFPVNPCAQKLIEMAGLPVAAPSANRSGRPSTTTAQHCIEDLSGLVDMIVDGGPCSIGLESTIIDVTGDCPALLRPGAVTVEMITELLGKEPVIDKALKGPLSEGEKPKAPGMKYRHYAPKAPLTLVKGKDGTEKEKVWDRMAKLYREAEDEGKKTEILCSEECALYLKDKGEFCIKLLGSEKDPQEISRELFAALRDMDLSEAEMIIAQGFSEEKLFLAVMNRLKKASGWHIEEV